MLRIRGHHLLCLQFFEGKGYSERFVNNMKNVVKRLRRGERIKIVRGKDDICSFCPHLNNGECTLDEKVYKKDKSVLKLFHLNSGDIVSWDRVVDIFKSLSKKDFLNICKECLWKDICFK